MLLKTALQFMQSKNTNSDRLHAQSLNSKLHPSMLNVTCSDKAVTKRQLGHSELLIPTEVQSRSLNLTSVSKLCIMQR